MLHRRATSGSAFTEAYKLAVFQAWYARGKPAAQHLMAMIDTDPVRGDKPTFETLSTWIASEFNAQAELLDQQVQQRMATLAVEEKVAMLKKHSETAMRMQEVALDYLEAHKADLKVPNAVRLLVEGVRIERESRGIPQALEKMQDRSNEELLKQLTDIITAAPVQIEAIEDE